jgi:hypothetical protein
MRTETISILIDLLDFYETASIDEQLWLNDSECNGEERKIALSNVKYYKKKVREINKCIKWVKTK